jgi:hypothetical protein
MQHCSKLPVKLYTYLKSSLKGPTACFCLYDHLKVLNLLFLGGEGSWEMVGEENCTAHLLSLGLILVVPYIHFCICLGWATVLVLHVCAEQISVAFSPKKHRV